MSGIRVGIWNEFRHEKKDEAVMAIYPDGIHECLAGFICKAGYDCKTATLDEPEHGLTQEFLDSTDVLIWWGHIAHQEVQDEIVDRVQKRVLEGMGLIVLHSGHASKIFQRMMGTRTELLRWREDGKREVLWNVHPSHLITRDLPEYFILPQEEMYGEYFHIPQPDELVLISNFEGGEVFRSGCCWYRELGKIFYFRPGHEEFPTYEDKYVQKVILNSIEWAGVSRRKVMTEGNVEPVV